MTEVVGDDFDDDDRNDGSIVGPERPPLVSRVRVKRLYNRYTYDFLVPHTQKSNRVVLFYGDNGRGKTTLLRLMWHLLSPAPNRHHRSRIADVPFESFEVQLSDSTRIVAARQAAVKGPYTISAYSSKGELVSQGEWPGANATFSDWDLDLLEQADIPAEYLDEARREVARRRYLEMLEALDARPYYLADDRNIYSDELDESKLRGRAVREQARAWRPGGSSATRDEAENTNVASELQASMSRANELLRSQTLGATQSGSANANSVYLDVLARLAVVQPDSHSFADNQAQLQERVLKLRERSLDFEALRLVPEFPGTRLAEIIASLSDDRLIVAEQVLAPFLSSLDARLDALSESQRLIATFLQQSNGFLTDKRMTFSPQLGLRIATSEERLTALQLSSGERQLILLLCNALLARQGSRIFLIDEPELSLNVKWQRRILDALLATTDGTSVQFFIATHSVELLSNYRNNVVRLKSSD